MTILFLEGEQEAAWLQEAGYGFVVSKIEGKCTELVRFRLLKK